MTGNPFRGIFTIPSTPFLPSGEIDVEGFRSIVRFCIECGAHGLVYPVNASEFTTLSDAERMRLAEVLVDENAHRVPAIIGVAGVSREHAAAFARHAAEIGAEGAIAMPMYVKRGRPSDQVIVDYYHAISDAGRLPIFIQNYAGPIGTELAPELLIRLCREIEWVSYVKEETVPSTLMHSAIADANDGSCLGCFGGAGGRYMIEEYKRGTAGNMPGCHVTDVMVAFWNALGGDDAAEALRIYKELAPLYFYESQLPGTYKEVLKRRGVIEHAATRNGTIELDEAASSYLDEILSELEPLLTWHAAGVAR